MSLHWFCPRQHDDDGETYVDPATQSVLTDGDSKPDLTKQDLISETGERRKLVFDCLLILAYDGEDVAQHQEYLKRRLDRQLGKCDACIRGYYRSRRELVQRLTE